eukprot:gene7578-9853_t
MDLENGYTFHIAKTWNGENVSEKKHVEIMLRREDDSMRVIINAPYNGDPQPPSGKGSTMHLWDYEVVEVFFLGHDNKYLEIEVEDVMTVKTQNSFTLQNTIEHGDSSYLQLFPSDSHLFNYNYQQNDGQEKQRYHCRIFHPALFPATSGEKEPDFHRLEYFEKLPSDLCT